MRPYLAIIRDSFHEALASRVLWILLAITTVVLLALVPLGFIEQAGSYLSREDFLDRGKLMRKIVAAGKSTEPSPGRRVWELLDEPTRRMLQQQATEPNAAVRFRPLGDSLQAMIARRDFYRAEDWAQVSLPKAARELAAQGLETLPPDRLARFNRLALDAAFPDEIAPLPPKQLQLAYFHWELGLTLPVEREQLFPAMNQLIVTVLAIFLGVAGVFVAVMVTASMIPQTFEAGSIDLLLSKPIYRGGLFLAKFVGGCAFIAINAAYLIGGLWLILGVRFGLWNERLLLAIPLYLFLFAIYYSVSSFAGVVWRNAIVSVVIAVLFWFVCWIVGTANGLVEQLSLNPRRVVTIVPAGDDLIVVNNQGEVMRWDRGDNDWDAIFAARGEAQLPFGFNRRLVGPIYDPKGERILAVNFGMPGFSPLSASTRLFVGRRSDDWQRTEGVNVPDGTTSLFLAPNGDLLAVNSQGIHRLEGDLAARQEDINVFGLHIPLPQRGGRFVNFGPQVALRPLEGAAIDPHSGAIALFDGYRLVLLVPDSTGKYEKSSELAFELKLPGKVALADGAVFLALEGEVRRYDMELELQETLTPTAAGVPATATVSPDGRVLAVLDRAGKLWLYEVGKREPLGVSFAGQGDVSAVAFAGQTLLIADRLTRVTAYDLADGKVASRRQGPMPLAERIYRYALHPIYTVFPKPGELNQTVMALLTSKDNRPGAIRLDNGPPNGPQQRQDVWGPIWSNLLFLSVVLALACGYVSRKDF